MLNKNIKATLCLSIPVCNTKDLPDSAPRYDRHGTSLDCGGKGQCRWNMRKGNHCVCDKGYRYLETAQLCCKEGSSDEECKKKSEDKVSKVAVFHAGFQAG